MLAARFFIVERAIGEHSIIGFEKQNFSGECSTWVSGSRMFPAVEQTYEDLSERHQAESALIQSKRGARLAVLEALNPGESNSLGLTIMMQ